MKQFKRQRKCKFLLALALMLCMSAIFMPLPVLANSDTTPPTINAWVSGEKLNVIVEDDTGVDAILVDGTRINYTVNRTVSVNLKEYAGKSETISVSAIDFAGNKSEVVNIKNPYYTAPTATPPQITITQQPPQPIVSTPTPAPQPVRQTSSSTSVASTPAPTPKVTASPSPSATPESSIDESSLVSEIEETSPPNPFTAADGAGEVVDNANGAEDGKEFFTITTPDENTFYLVIDRQRGNHNVYFLNSVTESDLQALAEKDKEPEIEPVPTPEVVPEVSPEPEPEPEPKKKNNTGTIIFILLIIVGGGGAAYYFKILKPKQEHAGLDDDFGNDDFDDDYDELDQDEEDHYAFEQDDTDVNTSYDEE